MEGKKKKGGGGWKEAEGTWRSCQIKKHVKFGSVFLLLLLPPLRTSFATGTIREQRRGELRKAGRFERRHLATLDHGLNEKDAHFFPRRVRKRRLGMRAGQEKKKEDESCRSSRITRSSKHKRLVGSEIFKESLGFFEVSKFGPFLSLDQIFRPPLARAKRACVCAGERERGAFSSPLLSSPLRQRLLCFLPLPLPLRPWLPGAKGEEKEKEKREGGGRKKEFQFRDRGRGKGAFFFFSFICGGVRVCVSSCFSKKSCTRKSSSSSSSSSPLPSQTWLRHREEEKVTAAVIIIRKEKRILLS